MQERSEQITEGGKILPEPKKKKRTVKDLSVGPFTIGAFRSKSNARKVENGKIEIIKGRKKVLDSGNNELFDEDAEAPFFQK